MRGNRHRSAGFAYLALLFFVAVMGAALSVTGLLWSTAQTRAKERELLFIGRQFSAAIGSYYRATPGSIKRYPPTLNDLLEDPRQAARVRHLRRIYPDPMTSRAEWGTIRAADGGIAGVYSLSDKAAVKQEAVGNSLRGQTGGVARYSDWHFLFEPGAAAAPGAAAPSAHAGKAR